jgi:hypothetical protein
MIATVAPKPGMSDGVLVGVAVGVMVGVGGSGVAVGVDVGVGVSGVTVGVGVGVVAAGTETTKTENPGVSARSVTCSESALTTSVESG